MGFIGVSERGEDLACDAEVGMAHVLSFRGFREAERETAKIIGGHLLVSCMACRISSIDTSLTCVPSHH